MAAQAVGSGSCVPALGQRKYGSELAARGIAEEHGPGSEIMDC